MKLTHELLTYEALSEGVWAQNDLEADARYFAERSWGWQNTDAETYCPVAAAATEAAAQTASSMALMNKQLLEMAIDVFNEHDELGIHLEWDPRDERWQLGFGTRIPDELKSA